MTKETNSLIESRDIERFWSRVEKSNGCWAWTGSVDKTRRGSLSVRGKRMLAPRLSWMIHNGPIPDGLFACHSCDNPNCVNPGHLWLGTNADNIRDAASKGLLGMQLHPEKSFFATEQGRKLRARGAKHGSAKLDDGRVREIKRLLAADGVMCQIARRFGVSATTIQRIKSGRIWGHV